MDWINWKIVSDFAAAAGIAVSLIALSSSRRAQQRMDRLAHQSWADTYFRELTGWAGGVCLAISKAIHLAGSTDTSARCDVLAELSAGIDMGRWYLPNRIDGNYDKHKEPAYRGERQPALDWIVEAYNICRDESKFSNPHSRLVTCQRNFVSAIQEVIDPRTREASIRQVLDSFAPVAGLPKVESPLNNDR